MLPSIYKMKTTKHSVSFVRCVTSEDAEGLYDLDVSLIKSGVGVVQCLDDLSPSFVGYQEDIAKVLGDPGKGGVWLVAETEGEISGFVRIKPFPQKKLRHVGMLSIGVAPSKQNIGIGRCLISAALHTLRNDPVFGLVRIELGVAATNAAAIHLYETFGFAIEGCRRRFIREIDGSQIDDYLMVLFLDELGQRG